jgi:biopolymer transport protein ExbB/TolQ
MARRGSGLGTALKIAKAIDREMARSAREREREIKRVEREEARWQKEEERLQRQLDRENLATEKAEIKAAIQDAKDDYESRCLERKSLREKYVNMEIR